MRTRRAVSTALGMTMALAGCGGGGDTITVRGDFAGDAPATVRAEEAAVDAKVSTGAFLLEGLSAGPATLVLLNGTDETGRLELSGLPAGTELALRGLRVDEASGRAFPRSVEPKGVGVVLVNGVRMAAPGRIPERVDEAGIVLGFAREAGALLFRPDDGAVPDLRVVVGPASESITPDGDPVPLDGLAVGDSVRVLGRADEGYVIAERLTVPRHLALVKPSAAASDGDGGAGDDETGAPSTSSPSSSPLSTSTSVDRTSTSDGDAARAAAPVARVSAPVREAVRERRGNGAARGRAHGHARARGKKPKG